MTHGSSTPVTNAGRDRSATIRIWPHPLGGYHLKSSGDDATLAEAWNGTA
jgi:hypothetical protein